MDFRQMQFNVSEIFHSIQGEGTRTGLPCVFVRMQGCKLRCVWCDTPYALQKSKIEIMMNSQEIIDKVESFNCNFVEFTGGEPLEQPDITKLMRYFINNGFITAVETAGYLSVRDVPDEVIKIIDFKAPGSKMDKNNNFDNINYLNKHDEVKFVLDGRTDYDWAVQIMNTHNLSSRVDTILFSPVFGKLTYKDLAVWILEDKLNVRLQVQIHKHIWSPDTRGV